MREIAKHIGNMEGREYVQTLNLSPVKLKFYHHQFYRRMHTVAL
jgi:hypothetical protein